MNPNRLWRAGAFGVIVGVAFLTGGCALAPIAALGVAGNVADIYSAAFSAGTEVFSAGKLESVEFCTFEHGQAAVRSTMNDLRLRQKDLKLDKKEAVYTIIDDNNSKLEVTISRRTAAICTFKIDAGFFGGSEAYTRLVLKSIRARLPAASERPATQPAPPVDLFAPRRYGDFGSTQPAKLDD